MVIIETSVFTRQITALMSDEGYAAFQSGLAEHPDTGLSFPVAVASARFGLLPKDTENAAVPG